MSEITTLSNEAWSLLQRSVWEAVPLDKEILYPATDLVRLGFVDLVYHNGQVSMRANATGSDYTAHWDREFAKLEHANNLPV